MSTLTGVIKASTKIGTDAVPAESNLWAAGEFRIFTSLPYHLVSRESGVAKNWNYVFDLKKPPEGLTAATLNEIDIKLRMIETVKYGETSIQGPTASIQHTIKIKRVNTVTYGNIETRGAIAQLLLSNISVKLKTLVVDSASRNDAGKGLFNIEVSLV